MEDDTQKAGERKEIREVRVADHTKMKACISFCLRYLSENEGATLMLHTLPAHSNGNDDVAGEPKRKKAKLASPTANISRLVSVAEVVKREFSASRQAESKLPSGALLHQYNYIGCLPDSTNGSSKVNDDPVLLALEGKNHLKRISTAYMKIYLTTEPRPDLEALGCTYQEPLLPPKKSRSARARAKKRAAKAEVKENSSKIVPEDG